MASDFRGSGEDVIEEGTEVRERQAIIQLPDFSKMKVDARIHESKISMIEEGQDVDIRVDAFPEQRYAGTVDQVSSVPISSNWMRPDLKEYKATIKIVPNGADISKLKPGLTAEIEIRIEERDNVLQVPVQSVITIGDQRYIFVLTSGDKPVRREILIGQASDTMIEVKDGVEAGEEVILNPRTHFADELIELEEKLAMDKKKAQKEGAATDAAAAGSGKGSAAGKSPGAGKKPAGGGAASGGFLQRFDKDSDGKVSKEEAPDRLKERFDSLDTNKDGFLDAGEISKLRPPSGGGGGGGPRPGGDQRS